MYSEDDLAAAVQAGVLDEQAAGAFRQFVATRQHAPAVDEEHFRLVTGFNDIFVVIACVLLLAAVAWIGGAVAGGMGSVLFTAVAWGLAEFFVRRRRMALPAIVLLLAFVGGVWMAAYTVLKAARMDDRFAMSGASAAAAVAAWLHWRRFQVPITVAAGAAAVAGGVVALVLVGVPAAREWIGFISLGAGVAVFALAMRWDMADARRETRQSDVAFWLHLLAAPLLVHPAFAALGVLGGQTGLPQAVAVVALYLLIAVVSLCIDRRALMVSALAYVLYTFSALLKQYGVVSLGFAITALVIGSALLLLSAFWQRARAFVLRFLPPQLRARLAPLK